MTASTARSSFGDELLLRYRYRDGSVQAALPLGRRTRLPGSSLARRGHGHHVLGTRRWRVPQRPARALRQRTDHSATNVDGEVASCESSPQAAHSKCCTSGTAPVRSRAGTSTSRRQPCDQETGSTPWTGTDLWIDRDRQAQWKDEDEACAALLAGHVTAEDLTVAHETGEATIGAFDDFLRAIGDWRSFRPPLQWVAPQLPRDWAS
jgi:hypothetical protein